MALEPKLTDYVSVIMQLYEQFMQHRIDKQGVTPAKSLTYSTCSFIIFFMLMQFRGIYGFKTQWRWLINHPEVLPMLGWQQPPHRTTIARRYKALYEVIETFVLFIGQYAADLSEQFNLAHLIADKSLFKARGPVWHQADRKAGKVPNHLRNLDTDATWSKSGYHGWVYGYGLHIICTQAAFPTLITVQSASVSESWAIDHKAPEILAQLSPQTLTADDAYTQASRIRRWAKSQVALITPALRWTKGRYAKAYHRFINQPKQRRHLSKRRSSVEPLFDLIAKVIGTLTQQKQLPVKGFSNVRCCLAIAVLSVQVAMIANAIWKLPTRNVSHMAAVFQ